MIKHAPAPGRGPLRRKLRGLSRCPESGAALLLDRVDADRFRTCYPVYSFGDGPGGPPRVYLSGYRPPAEQVTPVYG